MGFGVDAAGDPGGVGVGALIGGRAWEEMAVGDGTNFDVVVAGGAGVIGVVETVCVGSVAIGMAVEILTAGVVVGSNVALGVGAKVTASGEVDPVQAVEYTTVNRAMATKRFRYRVIRRLRTRTLRF